MKICVYELGVASKRAAGAFLRQKKTFLDLFDYVNHEESSNCPNFNIFGFGDMSKKTRAEKS